MSNALSIMTTGLRFPEGPVCLPDGSVIVTEIAGGVVTHCFADGSKTAVAHTGGGPNGAALGPDGALYVCNNGGMDYTEIPSRGWILPGEQPADYVGGSIQRIDLTTGEVSVVYTECEGRPLRGPNDIVFDTAGGFWFTDHGKTRTRDRDRGGLYYALPDGSDIREVVYPLDAPNGVALSPAEDRVYVSESFTARVWAWTLSAPGEAIVKPRARVLGGDLVVGLGGYHLFDSMAVDPDGNVCVATLGDRSGITVASSDGSHVTHIDLPGPMPTNICFGGEDGRTAFATLSAQGELATWKWSAEQSPSIKS